MSIIPAFELGSWNAWILAIPMVVVVFSDMRATSVRETGKAGEFEPTREENLTAFASLLLMFFSFVYSVLLPLQLGTIWLYSGVVVYLFGIVFTILAILNFYSSSKDAVITEGLYRFTRNPVYLGIILMQCGIGIACASWLYLLLTVALLLLFNANIVAEERYCLYMYGEDYQKYKNNTPRWIGIPKS